MDTKYFYIKDNKPVGPLTLPELMEKDISFKTHLWTKGMENWDMLENIPELYNALRLKKENSTHFPKETTTQIKVEPVTPENTLKPNIIPTKSMFYLIVGGLIIVMLGGYLFLKLEVEKVKAESSRIEKELEQKYEKQQKQKYEKQQKQKQELIEKQLAEEKIKSQQDQDFISKYIDDNVYKVVKIGTQYWSGRNLNVSRFRNGDIIPVVLSNRDWIKAGENGQPACCCYDNVGYNCEKYGRLYNWFAVNDERGLAPEGWHVATDNEWKNLTDFLEPSPGQILKSTEDWEYTLDEDKYFLPFKGTNNVGFSALPGGFRQFDGSFNDIKVSTYLWSATETKWFDWAYFRPIESNSRSVYRLNTSKYVGASVRCLRD